MDKNIAEILEIIDAIESNVNDLSDRVDAIKVELDYLNDRVTMIEKLLKEICNKLNIPFKGDNDA